MKRVLPIVRLIWASLCFALALLTILRAPTYFTWQLAILITECGLLLTPLPLMALLPGWKRTKSGRIAAGLAVTSVLLLLSTAARGTRAAHAAEAEFAGVFPKDIPNRAFRLGRIVSSRNSTIASTTIEYVKADGQPLLLDFYRAEKPKAPLVIVIHGGSWSGGDRTQLTPLNALLVQQGYAVASIDYRLAPQHTYPAALYDVAAAISYLKGHADSLGIDASRIALLGRSAGGHLALLAAYTLNDPSIRGAISFYGPTDLRWGWEHPANKLVIDSRGTLNRFLGGTPADSAATYETASPINYTLQAMPTLLIHGARDELVSVHHSEMLAEKLQRRGMPFVFVELPWATHGCDYFLRGPCGQISTWAVERFLLNVLARDTSSI